MAKAFEDFKDLILTHYIDDEYQITIDKDPGHWSTGNGQMHTGLFYLLCALNDQITSTDKLRFTNVAHLCFIRIDHSIVFGLLNRNLNRPDLNSPDNYIGMMAGSYFVDQTVARNVNEYGGDYYYSFDNVNPFHWSLATWHGRFPGLVPFYKLCSGIKINIFSKLILFLMIKLGLHSDNSQNILMWMQLQIVKRECPFLSSYISDWEKKCEARYGSLGSMFATYFGSGHPLSVFTTFDGILK